MFRLVASITVIGGIAIAGTACSNAPTPDGGTTAKTAVGNAAASTANVRGTRVSEVLGMEADWMIPDTIADVISTSSPDIQVFGLPTAAAIGNAYTFDDGRGGTLDTAFITVEVIESSDAGVAPGDSLTVELPIPSGTTAAELATIDFGTSPWTLAVSSDGVFAGGDVTQVRDLDDLATPVDVVGATSPVAVFQVTNEDEIVLPIIDEPALASVDVSSTASLSDQLEGGIDRRN